jgi:hypothetical protein
VIDTIETDEGGQEIFSQPQNLAFKIRRAWILDVEVGPEELDRRRQAACSKGRRPTGPPIRRTGAIAAGASRYTTTTARAFYCEEEGYEGGRLRGAHPFATHHSILQQPARWCPCAQPRDLSWSFPARSSRRGPLTDRRFPAPLKARPALAVCASWALR